ncbi:MAG: GAF domain-containing protein [Phycisphaerales bacterium]|nr:GAF domain-containing protein [Phycisphaerae bacterium]NNF42236.1 GAF domain-containing protein [Phycisphaerales bacterium]NNM26945.1 GAF domain-containing protein [Phycisphaerales bacterium]
MLRARPYDDIAATLTARGTSAERRRAVVDALWAALHDRGVSWVGFYLERPEEPDDRRLVLEVCRDRPACSPIGSHGACGRALRSGRTLIVDDVTELGDGYIACDPRDRSEIVVPLIDPGTERGVLDLDSHELAAFDESDAHGLQRVLRVAGLLAE